MSKRRPKPYLRSFRRQCGFTQREIAFLLGGLAYKSVSKQERAVLEPTLRTVLAYEVLYDVPASELFTGVYDEVELTVIDRACALCELIEVGDFSPEAELKLAALRRIMSRREPKPAR